MDQRHLLYIHGYRGGGNSEIRPLATVSKNKIPKRQKYLLSPGGAHAKFLVFGFDKTPCYGFQKLFSKKFVMTPPLHFHHNHISIIHGLYVCKHVLGILN